MRSTFIYSQWNYCLLQAIVEKSTGKSFGDYARESIFDPLHLPTPTFDWPSDTNNAVPHGVRDDGTSQKIPTNNFNSSTGLAAGIGGKTSLKDHLKLFTALLDAYQHQCVNNVDITPGSPFTQLRTLFRPHIHLPGTVIEEQAYCLGLYRTVPPGNLSCASVNSLFPRKETPLFGSTEGKQSSDEIFHHSGVVPGFTISTFLIPRTKSGVVVCTNATPLIDGADCSGQLLLSALTGTPMPKNLEQLAEKAIKSHLGLWNQLNSFLIGFKTDTPPTHALEAYEGTYVNALGNFKIVVIAKKQGLRLSIMGKSATTYDLKPWDRDTFFWPGDREEELIVRGMHPNPTPQFHLVRFDVDARAVRSLIWQHERLMEPETFTKEVGQWPKL